MKGGKGLMRATNIEANRLLPLALWAALLAMPARGGEPGALLAECRAAHKARRADACVTLQRQAAGWARVAVAATVRTDRDIEMVAASGCVEVVTLGDHSQVTSAGIRRLAALPRLRRLVAPGRVGAADIEAISCLSSLEDLDLGDFVFDVGGTKSIGLFGRMPGMRRLSLRWLELGDVCVRAIEPLQGLEELDLIGNRITGAGLGELRALAKLRALSVLGVDAGGLSAIARLPCLEDLCFIVDQGDAREIDLRVLPRLKSLRIENTRPPKGEIHLPAALRRLELADNAVAARIDLASAPAIEEVVVELTAPVGGAGGGPGHGGGRSLAWLRSLAQLRGLTLTGAQSADAAGIAAIASLRSLTVHTSCLRPFCDRDLAALAGLRQLETIRAFVWSDEGIAALRAFPMLRDLAWVGPLKGGAIAGLGRLGRLRALTLDAMPGADGDPATSVLAAVSGLAELQELDISGTVSDKELTMLSRARALRELDLTRCDGFTDAGLASLMRASSTLKALNYTVRP
jgi:hypothetical protein